MNKVVSDLISRTAAIEQLDKCTALSGIGCEPVMAIRDVKALISALPTADAMARVLTISEISALANGDVVWVEFTDGLLLPMMVEDGCLMRWRFLWRICEDAFYDENYKARAWSSRPTDAQRRETPWN